MKRIFDLFFSTILFLVLIVPLVVICILIKIDSKGSILFVTERVGKNKKLFKMLKFRTMKQKTPQVHSNELKNPEKHITLIGKYLRKYSLDELPQLINIIFGDMSLVGPRPSLVNQYELIDKREIYKIHELKPGLTGLAQINGRDNISIDKKIFFDNQYKLNASFLFDLKIMFKTMKVVFTSRGISH